MRQFEQDKIAQGEDSPFNKLLIDPTNELLDDRISTVLTMLEGYDQLSEEWSNTMQSLYDGVLGALSHIRQGTDSQQIIRIKYAHGVNQEIPGDEFQLVINDPDIIDNEVDIGDIVSINTIPIRIEKRDTIRGQLVLSVRKI
ncbi:hypothetical protein ACFLRP_00805 [Bacteroidota bacterium]